MRAVAARRGTAQRAEYQDLLAIAGTKTTHSHTRFADYRDTGAVLADKGQTTAAGAGVPGKALGNSAANPCTPNSDKKFNLLMAMQCRNLLIYTGVHARRPPSEL